MTYRIEFKPSALKSLKKLSKDVQRRIGVKIDSLSENPRTPGVEKLSGKHDLYRVKVGNYRIVYTIYDDKLLVLVVEIGHRREIYQRMR